MEMMMCGIMENLLVIIMQYLSMWKNAVFGSKYQNGILIFDDNFIFFRFEHPANALAPISETLSDIYTESNFSQSQKVSKVIIVNPSVSLTLCKLTQPLNDADPILFKFSERTTFVKLLQPSNASFPILVTLLGISIYVKPIQ